jgi:tetratricopeptide (TPR) repeat protein
MGARSNMRSSEADIRKANECMAAGKKEEARLSLQKVLARYPDEKGVYEDAVNIYLLGKLFDEAIAVFGLYRERFKQNLHTDFSLKEIEKEKEQYESAARRWHSEENKVFKRMSIFERGHFSNLPMISPVKEVALSTEGITLKKGGKDQYRWMEINDAFVTSREGYKGYFLGEDTYRTLHIQAGNQTFNIDISEKFPDLKDSGMFVQELEKYISIRTKEKGLG